MDNKRLDKIRKEAQKLLKNKHIDLNTSQFKSDINSLIEELSIYQIELELQNNELQSTQENLEYQKAKFTDLFNNAPVGYMLLNEKGIIKTCNVKVEKILAYPKQTLIEKPFVVFLNDDNKDIFYKHLSDVFVNKNNNEIESNFVIFDKNSEKKYIKFKSNIFNDINTNEKLCRTIIEDITEIKNNQIKVNELNNRLEASMIAGNIAWWEIEIPSGKIWFNKNKTEMLGYQQKDFVHYTHFTDLLHPDDYDNTMNAFRAHMNGEKDRYECQYRIKNINGDYLWFYDIGKITSKKNNSFILNGIVINITDRKKSEEILLKEREQFISLLDSIPALIYTADKDSHQILYANKSLKSNFNTNIIGKKCYSVLHNCSKECDFCTNEIIFEDNKPHYWQHHNSVLNKDFYVMDKAMQWTNGKTVRFEFALDITEIKNMERKLKKSEQNLSTLIHNVPLAVFLLDIKNNGKFILVNNVAEKYTGYTKNELLKMTVGDIDKKSIERDDKKSIWDNLEHNKLYTLETEHQRKDGSTYIAEVNFSLINFNNKDLALSVVQDITDKKNNEKKLIELNATKDKFFNIIAHDLKNPFNTILGFSELVTSKIDTYDKEKIKKLVENINTSANNAYKLLENLLTWSRSQTDRIDFNPEEINLYNIILEALGIVKAQAQNKEIEVKNNIQDGTIVFADKNMIKTIIRNLLSNAIKFTEKNGKINISYNKSEQYYEISVKDNGVGMSKDIANNLFSINKKTSTQGTEKEKGTGLGLLLCKEFIDKHNGKIQVESELNKGSEFTIFIPKSKKK